MTAISIAEAKTHLSEYINKAHFAHEEIILQKHGKPVVAMIDYEEYIKLKESKPKSDDKLTYKKLNPLEHIVKTDYSKYIDESVDDGDVKISMFDNDKDAVTLAKELRERAWR